MGKKERLHKEALSIDKVKEKYYDENHRYLDPDKIMDVADFHAMLENVEIMLEGMKGLVKDHNIIMEIELSGLKNLKALINGGMDDMDSATESFTHLKQGIISATSLSMRKNEHIYKDLFVEMHKLLTQIHRYGSINAKYLISTNPALKQACATHIAMKMGKIDLNDYSDILLENNILGGDTELIKSTLISILSSICDTGNNIIFLIEVLFGNKFSECWKKDSDVIGSRLASDYSVIAKDITSAALIEIINAVQNTVTDRLDFIEDILSQKDSDCLVTKSGRTSSYDLDSCEDDDTGISAFLNRIKNGGDINEEK